MVSNDPVAYICIAKARCVCIKSAKADGKQLNKVHKGFVDVTARCKSCLVLHEEHEHAHALYG
jgi:hypothetical protein